MKITTFLNNFVKTVSEDGNCQTFIIHARKAWLQGLSPKENREVPPLQYDIVEKIKDAFPHLHIPVNGGIRTIEDIKEKLNKFDGVMIGREAYQNPWFLRDVETTFFDTQNLPPPEQIVEQDDPLYHRPTKTVWHPR